MDARSFLFYKREEFERQGDVMGWINFDDACRAVGVYGEELHRMVNEGEVPVYKMGTELRFKSEELEDWKLMRRTEDEETKQIFNERFNENESTDTEL